jgi:lysophospholipid acyltransferase (LPLAT)-like uncharacterized protein
MKIGKKLLHNRVIRNLLCLIIAFYIKLVYATSRWEIGNEAILDWQKNNKDGALFMFWHGRLFLMPIVCPDTSRTDVIISHHVDGELISRTMEYFGLSIIRGSTDKGSTQVLRQVIRTLRKGRSIAITPDGPRGPRMCVNSNIAAIAKITGAPVIPVTFSAEKARILPSWDRFLLPKPFGKGIILCGEPIFVSPDASEEELEKTKLLLEETLNTMNQEADRRSGIPPVMPEDRNTPPKKRRSAA